MAKSNYVTSSDMILASQYNNLRDDAISHTESHQHSGNTFDGRPVKAVNAGTSDNRPSGAETRAGYVYADTDRKRLDISFANGSWTPGPVIQVPGVGTSALSAPDGTWPLYYGDGLCFLSGLHLGQIVSTNDVILGIPHPTGMEITPCFLSGILQLARGSSTDEPMIARWHVLLARSKDNFQVSIMPLTGTASPEFDLTVVSFIYAGARYLGFQTNRTGLWGTFIGHFLNSRTSVLPQVISASQVSSVAVVYRGYQIGGIINVMGNKVGINLGSHVEPQANLEVEGDVKVNGMVNGVQIEYFLPTAATAVDLVTQEVSVSSTDFVQVEASDIILDGRGCTFKLCGHFKTVATSAQIQLYNVTNSQVLATFNISSTNDYWQFQAPTQTISLPYGEKRYCIRAKSGSANVALQMRNVKIYQRSLA